MSINDPQWGNSHRPEQKDPEQVPEQAGTEPVQLDGAETPIKEVEPPAGGPQMPSGPPEGPPDLEVLWQQLVHGMRCKMALILRRELPALPEGLKEGVVAQAPLTSDESLGWQALSLKSWLIGVSLLFGAWLMSGFYLVEANQRGVLSRFGAIVSTEDPGWHWRWPYPLESVRLVNVTSDRTLEVGVVDAKRQAPLMMLTADQSLVGVGYAVVYQLTDPVAYLSRTEVPAELLGVLAESALRQVVATQPLAVVQGASAKQDGGSAPFLEDVRQQLQTSLNELNAGVQIKAIQIQNIVLPSPVLQAAKLAMQDEQTQIMALREAQLAVGESLIKARKLANLLQEETTGYTQALDVAAMRLNASSPKPGADDALNQVATANANLRQQYPLVFDSYDELVAKIRPAGAQPKQNASKEADVVSVPKASKWRDPELMRSRDRVGRPGSGS